MRIAHTPALYARHIGGVEAVDQVLAEWSLRHADEVVVLCADEPPGPPGSVKGVPVRRLPWRRKLTGSNPKLSLPRALWHEPWDVVHTHLPTSFTAHVSVLVTRLGRRRSVSHFHNSLVGDGTAGHGGRRRRSSTAALRRRLSFTCRSPPVAVREAGCSPLHQSAGPGRPLPGGQGREGPLCGC